MNVDNPRAHGAIEFPQSPEPVVRRLVVERFVAARNEWKEALTPGGDTRAFALTCVTFNTWFQGPEAERRYRGLLEVLRAADADVIMLQEANTQLLGLLLSADWVRARYAYARAPFRVDAIPSHGVMLLSRLPLTRATLYPLPTHMGRALLTAETIVNGATFVFSTVHLESMKPYADVRGEQLKEIFPILDGAQHAVLAGDFNFCSSWPEENGRLDPRYIDLWPVVRPAEPGYTQDTDVNLMLARAKQQSRKVRFDRILLRGASETGRWIPEHAELLGTTPVDCGRSNIFPSDHFGIAARIRFVA